MPCETPTYGNSRRVTIGITSFGVAGYILIVSLLAAFFVATCFAAKNDATAYNPAHFKQTVRSGMKSCSERFDYNPDAAIGETSLGKNERAWRACVYKIIEEKIIPKTRVPDMYKSLIAEDRAMTNAIQDGRLTRSQRRSRLEQLANEISAAEAAQIAASDPTVKKTEAQQRTEFVQRMVNGLR